MDKLSPAELSRLGDLNYRCRSLRQALTAAESVEHDELWERWRGTPPRAWGEEERA